MLTAHTEQSEGTARASIKCTVACLSSVLTCKPSFSPRRLENDILNEMPGFEVQGLVFLFIVVGSDPFLCSLKFS